MLRITAVLRSLQQLSTQRKSFFAFRISESKPSSCRRDRHLSERSQSLSKLNANHKRNNVLPPARFLSAKTIVVDGLAVTIEESSDTSFDIKDTSVNAVVVLCLLKSRSSVPEILLLSKYREDLKSISIEPPSSRLSDKEGVLEASKREVRAITGYTITRFPSRSKALHSECWQNSSSDTKIVLAEIDLNSSENQSAQLVHELGEKITVVRLPFVGLLPALEAMASEGRYINSTLYAFAQGIDAAQKLSMGSASLATTASKALGAAWMGLSLVVGAVFASWGSHS